MVVVQRLPGHAKHRIRPGANGNLFDQSTLHVINKGLGVFIDLDLVQLLIHTELTYTLVNFYTGMKSPCSCKDQNNITFLIQYDKIAACHFQLKNGMELAFLCT